MRKKLWATMKIAAIFSVALCSMGGIIAYGFSSTSTDNVPSSTVWEEVPINEGTYNVSATYSDFNLEKTFTEADYIFSGTIVGRTEYEVSWVDNNGEAWGPYPSSVIEVNVSDDYYGTSPVEGNIIKVYYPNSLSANIDGSFQLKEGNEYIFITQALDEEFIRKKAEESPDDKFEQEKHADVFISNARSNVISISDEGTLVYKGFFDDDSEILNQSSANQLYAFNNVLTDNTIASNDFLLLDKSVFDSSFANLISNREDVLTATNLTRLN